MEYRHHRDPRHRLTAPVKTALPQSSGDAYEKAIEYRAVWREPIGTSSYRLVPSAAPELRACLLDLVHNDSARAQCAAYFLTRIDKWRDEYGTPNDEPRHPNLKSGLAWPPQMQR